MVSLVLVVVALFSLVAAQSQYTVNLQFDGGLPFCNQCGENGQYACSGIPGQPPVGNWMNGTQTFSNPAPTGYVVTGVSATVYGSFGCNSQGSVAIFGINLNGFLLDVHQGVSNNTCKCGTCDGGVVFTSQFNTNYEVDMPNYNYDSPNTLQVVLFKDSICVNRIEVIITAVKATPTVFSVTEKIFTVGHNDCGQNCGAPGVCFCPYFDGTKSFSFSIRDPVPKGAILLTVATSVYGASDNGNPNKYNLTSILVATIVGTVKGNYSGNYLCQGRTFISADSFYQNGWPGYAYGSLNTMYVTVSATGPSLCFSTVEVQFYYYLPSTTTTSTPVSISP